MSRLSAREELVSTAHESWAWLRADGALRTTLTCAAYVLISLLIGLVQILREPQLSPYDEAVHLDYAWKASSGELPFPGSPISPTMLDAWSCHGQANATLPDCGSGAPSSEYPARGENYLMHPPTFYLISGYLARFILAVSPVDDFVTAARFTGLLWLAAGMIVLYAALRAWGVRWTIAAPIAIVPVTLHMTFQVSASLNNDATATLAGAAAAFLAARVLRNHRFGVVLPVLLTTFLVSTKILNAIPLLGVAVAIILASLLNRGSNRWPGLRQTLPVSLAILATTVAVHASWSMYRSATKVDGWVSPVSGESTLEIRGTPVGEWLETAFDGIRGLTYGHAPGNILVSANIPWVELLSPLLLASVFICLVIFTTSDERWFVPAATVIGMLGLPLAVQLQVYLITDGTYYFPSITSRYSLSLVALLIVCGSLVLEERQWVRPVWVMTTIGLVATTMAVSLG
ncbi:hypothetical protein ATL42_0357 [Sanguibacter antarcticus]|uniref:Dolichyl-phosphate-mannose-protein mannosyltransferase n=1 Tax=Sanguibacter antarcticus TaxID=372484 RepID=A0A2A9E0E7_9MICO|nr:hypothetical protein ATL42_0357 [Sanguibacter antarcticus]